MREIVKVGTHVFEQAEAGEIEALRMVNAVLPTVARGIIKKREELYRICVTEQDSEL